MKWLELMVLVMTNRTNGFSYYDNNDFKDDDSVGSDSFSIFT